MSETQTVLAIIEASEPDMRLVQAAVADLARQSAAELECLRYDVHQSVKMPGRLIIYEIWGSEEGLQRHRESLHVAQFKSAIIHTTATVWASVCRPIQ
jgi:quinol monooxygenase YgiN